MGDAVGRIILLALGGRILWGNRATEALPALRRSEAIGALIAAKVLPAASFFSLMKTESARLAWVSRVVMPGGIRDWSDYVSRQRRGCGGFGSEVAQGRSKMIGRSPLGP